MHTGLAWSSSLERRMENEHGIYIHGLVGCTDGGQFVWVFLSSRDVFRLLLRRRTLMRMPRFWVMSRLGRNASSGQEREFEAIMALSRLATGQGCKRIVV